MKAFISLTAWALALGGVASAPTQVYEANLQPYLLTRAGTIEERATCKPVNYTFQVTVPGSGSNTAAPSFSFGGLTYRLPQAATVGQLVSFYGNFANGQTKTSQTTTISNSTSNDDPNAPSMSSATGTANDTVITSTTFSQGNASSGAAGANSSPGDSSTSTSTSSSGAANSTVTATSDAIGVVTIWTNATVADASNAQSLNNERQAAAATSCAADNNGASAEAQEITSVSYQTGSGVDYTSTAYAACSAGLMAPSSGSSSSGSQATVSGVSAMATCNGVTTTNTQSSTTFRVMIVGTYCVGGSTPGFTGAIAGQRVADSQAMC